MYRVASQPELVVDCLIIRHGYGDIERGEVGSERHERPNFETKPFHSIAEMHSFQQTGSWGPSAGRASSKDNRLFAGHVVMRLITHLVHLVVSFVRQQLRFSAADTSHAESAGDHLDLSRAAAMKVVQTAGRETVGNRGAPGVCRKAGGH